MTTLIMTSGFDWWPYILVVILFLISLGVAAYATYAERKVAAFLQDRLGPNRAGPFGILQPIADGVKMFMKEEIIPNVSNKTLFILGPAIAMLTALLTGAVIPWGPDVVVDGKVYRLQVTDVNIGVLYLLGVVSIGVYGIMIGGWASNNKYALLGALRASSQMISYEVAMGVSIVTLIMFTGTLSTAEIAQQQHGFWADGYFTWNFFKNPLVFLIFFICALAETNRTPFDLPECETELVGGYHTEYSSMKLGFYLFAEYVNMFISSAVISLFFFGGYNFPFMDQIDNQLLVSLIGVGVMFAKTVFFIFVFMWIRWTIPRFRYDQLMNLGWKVLIPLSLVNLAITGLVMYFTGNLE
ncbi:MAG: NADH-quinone oxidoreductase subunit NuoH [Bacteroidetes bacterium]|jgi:NADH-quinone oxidoreductase subunit H|nr:NADH-quinone oxidoreductase subunit NuoH [Bacteroidota bacterium]